MIAERFRIDQSSSLSRSTEKRRFERNDSLVITSIHDRRPVSRLSSFGVVLFHRLLGNFSGMFWGSSEKSQIAASESFEISKGQGEEKDGIELLYNDTQRTLNW